MADVMAERRNSPRFALSLVADVREPFSPTEMIGRLSDISRTGCYIDTREPLAPGMHVKIRLRMEDELFETLAKVIHVNPRRGMGLHWGSNPQEQSITVLNDWLRHTLMVSRTE
jgi:PilZ domain